MSPRVHFATLSIRESSQGRTYYVGFLGHSRLLGFPGREPDRFGNSTIELFVVEPERRDVPSGAGARPVSRPRPEPAGGDDFDDHEQLGRIGR